MTKENSNLPPIYKRNEKDCYLDPIRKKLIYITPEETVRQEVVAYLINTLQVPSEMIRVEQHLSHYGIDTKKRADIVIHKIDKEGTLRPVAVIECKAPNVYLDINAQEQMLEYCDLIGADYAMMVNGVKMNCFFYDESQECYITLEDLPKYSDMCNGKFEEFEIGELPERIPFDELESFLRNAFDCCEDDYYGTDISRFTPFELAVPLFNFWEGLLDTRVKMPPGDYGLFTLLEDYGVRMVSYGNASGGKFYGPYRSFLVQSGKNTEIFSISVTTYWKSSTPGNIKTCICVAHDDEKEAHHALQLVAEDNLIVNGNTIDFYHSGRIAVGKLGSGKIEELRSFVKEKYPQIIKGNKFYLGRLVNNRLWRLDDPEVINLIVNMISYAIIRDEYREFVKNKKKSMQ